ncbi:MAG TPA: hypothetical protein DCR97_14975 [Deltaproteobacteria bacterium]|nr:hypothetical protein [Deltaproteobacteria bacterium]
MYQRIHSRHNGFGGYVRQKKESIPVCFQRRPSSDLGLSKDIEPFQVLTACISERNRDQKGP